MAASMAVLRRIHVHVLPRVEPKPGAYLRAASGARGAYLIVHATKKRPKVNGHEHWLCWCERARLTDLRQGDDVILFRWNGKGWP